MICPECFHDQPDGSQRCGNCGTVYAQWGGEERGATAGRKAAKASRGGGTRAGEDSSPRRRIGLRMFGLMVLVLVGALGWLVLEPPLRTVLRPGTVVFVSRRDGNPEIYMMRSSGLEPRRLTSHPAADYSPVLSRDGQQVAFVSERDGNPEIYVVGLDGTGLRRLTSLPTADLGPRWSPDGRHVAFVSVGPDGKRDIVVARADGQGVVNLTSHPADDHSPAWSPGATQLAFISDREGSPAVYVMFADGRDLRRLTQHAGADSSPAWSPDGRRLAFVWMGDIYVTDTQAGAPQRLTDRTRAAGGATGAYESPLWSPDGRKIAAAWVDRAGGAAELVVVQSDGSGPEVLGPAEPGTAVWMADSGSLAFVTAPQAGRRWFKARPFSGAKQICLRRLGRDNVWARLSDQARGLALSALGGPGGVDASLEILTELGGEDPDWSPGGSEGLPRFWTSVSWEGA
jgi:TolB protein